jgi:RNA polymerase sporulation-specific sigma factor
MISEDIYNTNDSELLMLYQENNEDAKNILYMKYKFIIDILIKKYSKYISDLNIDYQEVYSECYVGFSDSLRSYKEDKNASLPTFITLCVERKLSAIIRKYNREKYKILQDSYSLDFMYNDDLRLMDIISDDSAEPLKNITEKERYDELLNNIKARLTKKEYEVFTLMIRGLNYNEIAKILGVSSKQVDNAMQRIKNKVKQIISD